MLGTGEGSGVGRSRLRREENPFEHTRCVMRLFSFSKKKKKLAVFFHLSLLDFGLLTKEMMHTSIVVLDEWLV